MHNGTENMMRNAMALLMVLVAAGTVQAEPKPGAVKDIKSYCIDFNWGARRRFAQPGLHHLADQQQHHASACRQL